MDTSPRNASTSLKLNEIVGLEIFNGVDHADERGSFRRIYDSSILFRDDSLHFVQGSLSKNSLSGTVRGLHFQKFPSQEWKLITCIKGSLFDVLVDIRSDSKTFGDHVTFELHEKQPLSILVPPGFAHGFQTIVDDTWVLYQMTDSHKSELASRLFYRDQTLGIKWPLKVTNITNEDKGAPAWPAKY
jgi:dTDP-4-dehydrorhamnose 3,5-epimerase